MENSKLQIVWANTHELREEAMALRYRIFTLELRNHSRSDFFEERGIESDIYDDYCEHLLLRTTATNGYPSKTIGTYRVLTPEAAKRVGSYYSQNFFILTPELQSTPGLIELGRACVDKDWRGSVAVLKLWTAIAEFMKSIGAKNLIGCVSSSLADGMEEAGRIWQTLRENSKYPLGVLAQPRSPLILPENLEIFKLPPLINGYVKSGGRVLCAPAYDTFFNTADFLLYCSLDDINKRYKKKFFK